MSILDDLLDDNADPRSFADLPLPQAIEDRLAFILTTAARLLRAGYAPTDALMNATAMVCNAFVLDAEQPEDAQQAEL